MAAGGAAVTALTLDVEVALPVGAFVHHVEVGEAVALFTSTDAVPTPPFGVVTVWNELVAVEVMRGVVAVTERETEAVALGKEDERL